MTQEFSTIPRGTAATVCLTADTSIHRLSLQRIASAHQFIDAAFLHSPQYEVESLASLLGCRLIAKVECLNPIRSFKARGAQFLAAGLPKASRLVCSSSGNFGQGLATASRKYGHTVTVFTGLDASPLKIGRMKALGAEVRQIGTDADETQRAAESHASDTGARLIADGREARRWITAHSPATRIVGVCSAGTPAMARSWKAGRVTHVASGETIADGLSISTPHAESLADVGRLVDDILLVEDAALIEGMRLAHRELGVVLEPSGAAGIAALLTNGDPFRGQLVATILTGGNLTSRQMQAWLTAGSGSP